MFNNSLNQNVLESNQYSQNLHGNAVQLQQFRPNSQRRPQRYVINVLYYRSTTLLCKKKTNRGTTDTGGSAQRSSYNRQFWSGFLFVFGNKKYIPRTKVEFVLS